MEEFIVMAKESEREEILSLYRSQLGREYCAWDEDYPGNDEISFDLSRDALFVMKRDGKIIGAVSIEEDQDVDDLPCWNPDLAPGGELARLCVSPEHQNEGLARKLMSFGIRELKNRGFRSIHFLVNKYNLKASRSYAVLTITSSASVICMTRISCAMRRQYERAAAKFIGKSPMRSPHRSRLGNITHETVPPPKIPYDFWSI